jgi:thiol-disulfide isomerase/thioredoxin
MIRCLIVIMMLACPAFATPAQNEARARVSADVIVEPPQLRPGGRAALKITLRLAADAHVNSNAPVDAQLIPTVFTPSPMPGINWGAPQYPDPTQVVEWYSTEPLVVYTDGSIITVPFEIAANSKEGKVAIGGKLLAQACDHEKCYPAQRIDISASLSISGSSSGSSGGAGATIFAQTPTSTTPPAQAPGTLAPGATIPDFTFTDFKGQERRFAEYRGKYVLLDFWATWCKPCLADFPHLKELYAQYRERGFEILGLDSETLGDDVPDEETIKAAEKQAHAVIARFATDWTHANTRTAVPVAVKIFNVESLPTKILVDPQGKLIKVIKNREELDRLLTELLPAPRK